MKDYKKTFLCINIALLILFLFFVSFGIVAGLYVFQWNTLDNSISRFKTLLVTDNSYFEKEIELKGKVTCSEELSESCVDLKNLSNTTLLGQTTCITPIKNSCFPLNPVFQNITANNITTTNFTFINDMIGYDQNLIFEGLNIQNSYTCETLNNIEQKCFDLSGKSCPNGKISQICIPSYPLNATPSSAIIDGTITNSKISISSIETEKIVDGSIQDQHVIEVSANKMICSPLNKLSASCFDDNVEFDQLQINHLTTNSFTFINMMEQNHTTVITNSMYAENIVVTNSLSCAGLNSDCVPGLPASIVDNSVTFDINRIPFLNANKINSSILNQARYDISGHGYCDSQIDQSCSPPSVVADNSITNIKMADNSINTTEIQNLVIMASVIADGAITTNKIENNTIASFQIQDFTLTFSKLSCSDPLSNDVLNEQCIHPITDLTGSSCDSNPINETCVPQISISNVVCDITVPSNTLQSVTKLTRIDNSIIHVSLIPVNSWQYPWNNNLDIIATSPGVASDAYYISFLFDVQDTTINFQFDNVFFELGILDSLTNAVLFKKRIFADDIAGRLGGADIDGGFYSKVSQIVDNVPNGAVLRPAVFLPSGEELDGQTQITRCIFSAFRII